MDRSISVRSRKRDRVPLRKLAQVACVASGVQFGWALQLSLLTPYVQELGIPHAWASWIWLCGPISGMIVQPLVGHYSDNCTSPYGRRRPFIVGGALLVSVGVIIIGFSADIGTLLGDGSGFKPRAIGVFILGFWILDLANNTLQGPCRALLADFTGKDAKRTRRANAFFSAFMAVGNILGFATGSYDGWYKVLPFTLTVGCNEACANLKSAFLLGVVLLMVTTFFSVTAAKEKPWVPESNLPTSTTPLLADSKPKSEAEANGSSYGTLPKNTGEVAEAQSGTNTGSSASYVAIPDPANGPESNVADDDEDDDEEEEEMEEEETKWVLWELAAALRDLPRAMWFVLLVTGFTWLSWFPFLLFDTDWMGREVYKGDTESSASISQRERFSSGVHTGALGLMFNSVILGLSSLIVDPLCRSFGSRNVWALSNLVMTISLLATYVVGKWEGPLVDGGPPLHIYWSAIAIFAVLGFPLAVTYSVPYSLTATFTSSQGGGQGLSMGVLNLAVVIPQVIVSVGAGPWDALFGGGNEPAFLAAAVFAALGGAAALFLLPKPPPNMLPVSKLRRTMSSPIP